jgi:hypothetical protein
VTTIMVDLEGTLSDHTDRLRLLETTTQTDPKDREAWKRYYKGLPDDEPREYVLDAVKRWIRDDYNMIVYSTRFQNKYMHEEEWLRGHELWSHVQLLQRQQTKEERSIKGPDLVAIWASELKPAILVDDREDVRDKVSLCCPDIRVFGPEDFP